MSEDNCLDSGERKTFEEAKKTLLDFLDQLEPDERREKIDDFLHLLNFERRFMLLTDEERAHIMDEGLSPEQRKALDKDKALSEEAYEERLKGYARATYFRRMAWAAYLNGETEKKPFSSRPKGD